MKKLTFVLLTIISISCEDQDTACTTEDPLDLVPLYIDNACSASDTAIILTGVNKLNALAQNELCQDLIDVIGYATVDHEDLTLTGNKIACYYNEPEDWYYEYYPIAKGSSKAFTNIRLFFYLRAISQDARLSLILHELMHYVGVREHSTNTDDIMYTSDATKTSYTQGDIDNFCSVYHCL